MDNIDLNNTSWDRLRGFPTEHKIDSRWVLRDNDSDNPVGSLRIVSHPDLPPGHLRAVFSYMTSKREKTINEKIQTTEDYQMELKELEVYSIQDEIKTEQQKYEQPYRELEALFGVKVFE